MCPENSNPLDSVW